MSFYLAGATSSGRLGAASPPSPYGGDSVGYTSPAQRQVSPPGGSSRPLAWGQGADGSHAGAAASPARSDWRSVSKRLFSVNTVAPGDPDYVPPPPAAPTPIPVPRGVCTMCDQLLPKGHEELAGEERRLLGRMEHVMREMQAMCGVSPSPPRASSAPAPRPPSEADLHRQRLQEEEQRRQQEAEQWERICVLERDHQALHDQLSAEGIEADPPLLPLTGGLPAQPQRVEEQIALLYAANSKMHEQLHDEYRYRQAEAERAARAAAAERVARAFVFEPGSRVMRNPHCWLYGDDDGGEGRPGTVTEVDAGGGTATVHWDTDAEGVYRCGADGTYELLPYDRYEPPKAPAAPDAPPEAADAAPGELAAEPAPADSAAAEGLCAALHGAVLDKGLGEDPAPLMAQLGAVTAQAQWEATKRAFSEGHPDVHGGDLLEALARELPTADHAAVVAALAQNGVALEDPAVKAERLAAELYKAMKGLGTDEDAMYAAFGAVANQGEWDTVRSAFKAKHGDFHGGDVIQAATDELNDKELQRAKGILQDNGVEWDPPRKGEVAAAAAPPPPPDALPSEATVPPSASGSPLAPHRTVKTPPPAEPQTEEEAQSPGVAPDNAPADPVPASPPGSPPAPTSDDSSLPPAGGDAQVGGI